MENVRKIIFLQIKKYWPQGFVYSQHTPLIDASWSKVKLLCSIVKKFKRMYLAFILNFIYFYLYFFFYLGYKIVGNS